VGYSPPTHDASNVHFTIGGPYFDEYGDCEYAGQWRQELGAMLHVDRQHNN
jgi:hypothetical protein